MLLHLFLKEAIEPHLVAQIWFLLLQQAKNMLHDPYFKSNNRKSWPNYYDIFRLLNPFRNLFCGLVRLDGSVQGHWRRHDWFLPHPLHTALCFLLEHRANIVKTRYVFLPLAAQSTQKGCFFLTSWSLSWPIVSLLKRDWTSSERNCIRIWPDFLAESQFIQISVLTQLLPLPHWPSRSKKKPKSSNVAEKTTL